MITQIGISMLVPVFLCAFLGLWLNKIFSVDYLFIIFVILGVLAAFRSVYQLTRQFYQKDLDREIEEQRYFDELKKRDGK
ncbi:MAG: AtpZ/AtpI family protein [Lachnospiraceae bacterium]|nr:AtpZ/AtpI family protein [Lachnospiraceae bacterium]